MTPDLDAAIRHAFPATFAGVAAIGVGDGWAPIVRRRLAERLEPLCVRDGVRVAQLKEKFGQLRCYFTNANGELVGFSIGSVDAVDPHVAAVARALDEAKRRAAESCEECGAPSRLHDFDGLIFNRCPAHAAAVVKVRMERRRRWREGT